MPVEFIGMISTKDQSETRLSGGPVIDKRLHQEVRPRPRGRRLRRVLIGYASSQPDASSRGLRRRPHRAPRLPRRAPAGFVAPRSPPASSPPWTSSPAAGSRCTSLPAARRRAACRRGLPDQGRAVCPHRRVPGHRQAGLDRAQALRLPRHLLPGREPLLRRQVAAAAEDQAVLRRLVRGGLPGRRQARRHLRPVGEPLAETKQQIDSVNEAPKRRPHRHAGISVSFRPILADRGTGLGACHRILETTKENIASFRAQWGAKSWASAVTSRRTSARSGSWRPPPRRAARPRPLDSPGGRDRSGRQLDRPRRHPETVARALLDYVDIGVTTILIRATTRTTTRSTTAATCSRWSARRSPARRREGRRERRGRG